MQNWGAIANSIFVYEMGSLCLAHLGNIGHLLTPEQVKVLQHVDMMMMPIDAMTNLGFDDIIKVIEQVKPPIVIPMHYDVARQAELFAAFAKEHYPVKRITQSQLILNRCHAAEVDGDLRSGPSPRPWPSASDSLGGSADVRRIPARLMFISFPYNNRHYRFAARRWV